MRSSSCLVTSRRVSLEPCLRWMPALPPDRRPQGIIRMSLAERDAAQSSVRRDLSPARSWVRALELTAPIAKHPERLLSSVIEDLAERLGEAPALVSDRECMSYHALAARANQCTRWALRHRLGKADTVCLLMPNRP